MNRPDLLRRTATVVAMAACLVSVSGMAQAKFTGTKSGTVNVGTAKLVAPTAVTGTYQCRTGFLTEGVTFNVSSFNDAGPAGAGYRYRIYRNQGGSAVVSTSSTTRSATVETPLLGVDVGATEWTLTIESTLSNWTGPVFSKTITCGFLGSGKGSL